MWHLLAHLRVFRVHDGAVVESATHDSLVVSAVHANGLARRANLQLFKTEFSQWNKKIRQLPKDFPFTAGIMAERFDDSECMLDQIKHARRLGVENFALWVSKIKPTEAADTNKHIKNNLSLLKETEWGDAL